MRDTTHATTRRALLALLGCLALTLICPLWARADSFERTGGRVTFTSGRTLESSLARDALSDMQPGDDVTLTVSLSNEYAGDTDWYVSNEVTRAFEDSGATGAAYAYRLAYVSPAGSETVVFDSESVGGDGTSGLSSVSGLEDFAYLGTMSEGQAGSLTLRVALDGETQGNAYMQALADLRLAFAVEVPEAGVREVTQTVTETVREEVPEEGRQAATATTAPVRTGDDTRFLPAFVAMAASGAVLMAVALIRLKGESKGGDR